MKTMFKVYGILIISVLFAFTACEGPMGPAGADGSEFTTTIPESSGLRGTTWTWLEATGAGSASEFAFSADGKSYTMTLVDSPTAPLIVLTYRTIENVGEHGTGHLIQTLNSATGAASLSSHVFYINGNTLKLGGAMERDYVKQ